MKYLLVFLSLTVSKSFAQSLKGSWQNKDLVKTTLLIATDSYLTVTTFDEKQFIESWGGKYQLGATGEAFIEIDFHSGNPSIVNSSQSYNVSLKKKSLEFDTNKFLKIDNQKDNQLTGLWKITARANKEGKMDDMPIGPRKTLKIMSGYFQWFAINTQTREFFGTGGGKYAIDNAVYSEKIEFFSRDSSRVGAELNFRAEVSEKEWVHSGKSSKGEPIKEIWTKQ